MTRRLIAIYILAVGILAVLCTSSAPARQPGPLSMTQPIAHTSTLAASTTSPRCSPNATSATIGGTPTCLSADQPCQHPHAGEYRHYGFSCVESGNQYRLVKTSSRPTTSGSHPGHSSAAKRHL